VPQQGSCTKMNVVPVTIRALAPTNDTFVSLTWGDPARPDLAAALDRRTRRSAPKNGTPASLGGRRGPERAIADGGNRSPSSLKQQAETESSSSAISAPRAVLRQICGNSTYPAPSLGEISRAAAGITLAAKDQAARPNRQGLGARKCY